MDVAIGIVLLASVVAFLLGFGLVIGSGGEDTIMATVSASVVLACLVWFWGYFCGMPEAETKDEEDE